MNVATELSPLRPRIALAMGDPAGIAPELTARLLADREVTSAAQLLVIGDRRVLDEGARVAGVTLDLVHAISEDGIPAVHERPVLLDLGHLDPKSTASR